MHHELDDRLLHTKKNSRTLPTAWDMSDVERLFIADFVVQREDVQITWQLLVLDTPFQKLSTTSGEHNSEDSLYNLQMEVHYH
jgi:hypothetical protein